MPDIFTALFVLAIVIFTIGVGFLLSRREKKRAAQGLNRHGKLRLVFAAFAVTLMLFSGGCGTLLISDILSRPPQQYNIIGWEFVTVVSVPPFLIGLLIWWLSLRRKDG